MKLKWEEHIPGHYEALTPRYWAQIHTKRFGLEAKFFKEPKETFEDEPVKERTFDTGDVFAYKTKHPWLCRIYNWVSELTSHLVEWI